MTVALGCTSMTPFSYPGNPRRDEMISVLRGALDGGVTTFDTSEIQGPYTGEEMLGDAIGDAGAVVTKFGWEIADGTPTGRLNSHPDVIRASARGSLTRLRRERLDVFMQHRVDPTVPIEDVAGAVKELIDDGLVARFGLCEASPETIRRANAVCPVSVIQNEFSLWSRESASLFPLCEELDMTFMAYSPLGKGMLTGRATANDDSSSPRLHSENFSANMQLVDAVKSYASSIDRTPAQLALGWILAQRPFIMPVAGSTNLTRILDNTRTTALSTSEVARVDDIVAAHPVHGNRYTDKHLSFVER